MKKIFFFSFYLFSFLLYLNAQSSIVPSLPTVVPPSPNAASLGKFADMPVGLYNGIPEINIPLYKISLGNVEVPISLSYHSGGIMVVESSSNIGLGWALNAGGVITRSIHGLPDETAYGYIASPFPQGTACLGGVSATDFCYTNTIDKQNDTEPDMFYFNFNNVTGKFVFDKSGIPHTIPYSKIRIEQANSIPFSGWKITTEDGVQYIFNQMERTSNTVTSTPDFPSYTSAWYLTQIQLPNSTKNISFEYNVSSVSYQDPITETLRELQKQNCSPGSFGTACKMDGDHQFISLPSAYEENYSFTYTDVPTISKITFPNGTIEFSEGNYRWDMKGGKAMDEIMIKENRATIKRFKLGHKYFSSSTHLADDIGTATATTEADNTKRLCLADVTEYSGDNSSSKPPYLFSYYAFDNKGWLPDRLHSKAIDHWGFYNGHTENINLIPPHIDENDIFHPTGGLRNPVEDYAKVATLTKITYPTGGYTIFDFEQNDAESESLPYNIVQIQANYSVGFCHAQGSNTFVINDGITHTSTLTLSLSGTLNNFTYNSCSGNPSTIVPNYDDQNSFIYFQIVNVTDPLNPQVAYPASGSFVLPMPSSTSATVTLPNGTYKIQAVKGFSQTVITDADANFAQVAIFNVNGYYNLPGTKKVGGLRIAKMTDFDPIGNKNSTKSYDYTDGVLSSGKVNFIPSYNYPFQFCTCYYFEYYTSFSQAPLLQMQGGFAGYGKITVYNEEYHGSTTSSGKTEYYYSNPVDPLPNIDYQSVSNNNTTLCYMNRYSSGGIPSFPFAPQISTDWKRGQLLKKSDYKSANNTYVKVKEVINTYKDDYLGINEYSNNTVSDIVAAKIGIKGWEIYSENQIVYRYAVQYYFIPSRFSKLVRTEVYDYDDQGNSIRTESDYDYLNMSHLQLSKATSYKSDGKQLSTYYLYPGDYADLTGPIGQMKQANIINKPVETALCLSDASGQPISVLRASSVAYFQDSKIGLPNSTWITENRSPIPWSQFTFSNQSASGSYPETTPFNNYLRSTLYPLNSFEVLDYDAEGNIVAAQKTNDVSNAYLYGYYSQYPVAKITGSDYHTASALIIQSTLDDPSTTDADMRAELDKLRRRLPGAMVSTYTYAPLVGMTSETGPNGTTTYYSYDGMGRLQLVKDQDGNTTKKICYNYAGQPGNCSAATAFGNTVTFSSQTKVGSFTASCTASPISYTVPLGSFTSVVSQTDADQKAQADVDAHGQAYADKQANCSGTGVYLRVEVERPLEYIYDQDGFHVYQQYSSVFIRMYSDPQCTKRAFFGEGVPFEFHASTNLRNEWGMAIGDGLIADPPSYCSLGLGGRWGSEYLVDTYFTMYDSEWDDNDLDVDGFPIKVTLSSMPYIKCGGGATRYIIMPTKFWESFPPDYTPPAVNTNNMPCN